MEYTGIESYQLRNYKSVKNSGEISLDSTSIILGPNSSGKTNLVEPLLLLKQSMDSRGMDLTLNGQDIKLGNYTDIAHNQDKNKDISFEFYFRYKNEPDDGDRPLECPICYKDYKEEGWYSNHLEEEHEFFWDRRGDKLNKYESHPLSKPSVEISYTHSDKRGSAQLRKVVFSNPTQVGSLYVSEIAIGFFEEYINIYVEDINGDVVFDSGVTKEKISNPNLSNVYNISDIANVVLGHYTTGDRRTKLLRYSSNQPYIRDEAIPSASDYYDEIQSICKKTEESSEFNPDLSEFEDSKTRLFDGLLMRISSIIQKSDVLIGSIDSFLENISHVGPLRRSPQRIYSASEANSGEAYFRRVNIEDRLFPDVEQEESPILEATNEWLSKTGFDCELEIEGVEVGDIFQLKINEGDISVNLADSGFGLSQTIPIIIECMNMNINSKNPRKVQSKIFRPKVLDQYMTIVEEPEIHLNPKIESKMGDFFLDIKRDDTGVIVETHSEHIVNRIQRRIAEGSADRDSVAVYFVEKENGVTDLREINIREDGSFDQWPKGFFQEDLDDAIEMLKNRGKKEKK